MSEEAVAKAHVARLYYLRGATKQEIAARLGISRFKVARLLDQAREEGIVHIEVRQPLALDEGAADALEAAFGLDLAVVVRDPDDLPRAAARWLAELLAPGDVLGVAFGSTLGRVAEELSPATRGVPVVQLCGAIAGTDLGSGPAELALRFAERLGGQLYPLPAPAWAGGAGARDELLRNDALRPTAEMFASVTVALLGVGALEGGGRSALLRAGIEPPREAIGDLLVHLFDESGRMVGADLAERAVALPLDDLRGVRRVVAAAGGPGKQRAILGALRTGLVDVLVTDVQNARFALEGGR